MYLIIKTLSNLQCQKQLTTYINTKCKEHLTDSLINFS